MKPVKLLTCGVVVVLLAGLCAQCSPAAAADKPAAKKKAGKPAAKQDEKKLDEFDHMIIQLGLKGKQLGSFSSLREARAKKLADWLATAKGKKYTQLAEALREAGGARDEKKVFELMKQYRALDDEHWALRPKIRAEVMAALTLPQQRLWAGYVLMGRAMRYLRGPELTEEQSGKVRQVCNEMAAGFVDKNTVSKDPYLWGLDRIAREAAGQAAAKALTAEQQKRVLKRNLWAVTKLTTIEGFKVPEAVVHDTARDVLYVANVETDEGAYWGDDGKGFVSRLKPDGSVDKLRWRDSTKEAPLNAPKGMCVLDGMLYVGDNSRVMSYPLWSDEPGKQINIRGAQRLNDFATDGKHVYVSDTGAGKVYRITGEKIMVVKAPKGVNGITCVRRRMFAVSWDLHEVYELDPEGRDEPRAFGLADHFTNLDGIEVLHDGAILVSDFVGNKVSAISPDGKTVRTLLTVETPADIEYDSRRNRLYIPSFMRDRVVVCELEASEQK